MWGRITGKKDDEKPKRSSSASRTDSRKADTSHKTPKKEYQQPYQLSQTPPPPRIQQTQQRTRRASTPPAPRESLANPYAEIGHSRGHYPAMTIPPPPPRPDFGGYQGGRPPQGQPSPVSTDKSSRSSLSQSTGFRQSPSPGLNSAEMLQSSSRNENRTDVDNPVLPARPSNREDTVTNQQSQKQHSVDHSNEKLSYLESYGVSSTERSVGPVQSNSRHDSQPKPSREGSTSSDISKSSRSPPWQTSEQTQPSKQPEPVQQSQEPGIQQKQVKQPQEVQQQQTRKLEATKASLETDERKAGDVQQQRTTSVLQLQADGHLQPGYYGPQPQSKSSKETQPSNRPETSNQSQPRQPLPDNTNAFRETGGRKTADGQQQKRAPVTAQPNKHTSTVQTVLAETQRECASVALLLKEAHKEEEILRKEVEDVKNAAMLKEKELQEKVEELEDENEELNEEIEALGGRINAMGVYIKILNGDAKAVNELGEREEKVAGLQAENEMIKKKMENQESQHEKALSRQRRAWEAHLKGTNEKLQREHQHHSKQLQEHISQLNIQDVATKEKYAADVEELRKECAKQLIEKNNSLAQERKKHDDSFALTLNKQATEMTFLKESHRKEIRKREEQITMLGAICSTQESRHFEDTVKIKDLEDRLLESLNARAKAIDDREEHINKVSRSFNAALLQLQRGRSQEFEERRRLKTEITSLNSDVDRTVQSQKAVLTEGVKKDSAQPSPEGESGGPILERPTDLRQLQSEPDASRDVRPAPGSRG